MLYHRRLIDVGKHVTFDNALEFYKNIDGTSIDINPRSSLTNAATLPGEKAVVFGRPTRTQSGGSNSNYATLHPLFAQMTDQIKNKAGLDVVNEMMYKALGVLFKLNNESKNDNKEGVDIPPQSALPE